MAKEPRDNEQSSGPPNGERRPHLMAKFGTVVAWVLVLPVMVLTVLLVLGAIAFFVFFSPIFFSPLSYDSGPPSPLETPIETPAPTGTPPFASTPPPFTPFPSPGETGTVAPTVPPFTPFPSPVETGTVAPTLPPATPAQGLDRIITTHQADRIKVGGQAVIRVNVTRPGVQVAAPVFGRRYFSVVDTESGNIFAIYFVHPDPTLLTLEVGAENFRKSYNPAQVQEIFVETKDVEWTVSLSPDQDISGEQDITITLTQSLPSGERIPPDIDTVYREDIVIQIEAPEDPPIIKVLKWALPNGPLPLLVWFVSALALVLTYLGGRRIRQTRSGGKSSQEQENEG